MHDEELETWSIDEIIERCDNSIDQLNEAMKAQYFNFVYWFDTTSQMHTALWNQDHTNGGGYVETESAQKYKEFIAYELGCCWH